MRIAFLVLTLLALGAGAADSASAWSWPTTGEVLRPFAFGDDPYGGGLHRGVDIAGYDGEDVLAPAGGRVVFAGSVPGSGRTVTIETAGGYSVTLVHLGAVRVERGEAVAEGAAVGTVGATVNAEWPRPYVHLGVRVTADRHGYVDPLTLLPTRTPAAASPPSSAPTATVPAAPPPSLPPVTVPQPTPATPDPPAVPGGNAPPPPASPAVTVPARVGVPSPPGATGRRLLPPAAAPAMPSAAAGAPVEGPTTQPAPPPEPPPQPVGAAASPALPVAAPVDPVDVPAGAEPKLPAVGADPVAVPGAARPWRDPEGGSPHISVSALGSAAATVGRFVTRQAGPAVGRGSTTVATGVGGQADATTRHVPPVRASSEPGHRPDEGSPWPSRGRARARLFAGADVASGGEPRLHSSRPGGERALVPARVFAPASLLALGLLVTIVSVRRRDRKVVAALQDGADSLVGLAGAPTTCERASTAPCTAARGYRRPAHSCSPATADDPIAALLAAPRPRPAPQPAFRGRSGRSLAASHRARLAGLTEVC